MKKFGSYALLFCICSLLVLSISCSNSLEEEEKIEDLAEFNMENQQDLITMKPQVFTKMPQPGVFIIKEPDFTYQSGKYWHDKYADMSFAGPHISNAVFMKFSPKKNLGILYQNYYSIKKPNQTTVKITMRFKPTENISMWPILTYKGVIRSPGFRKFKKSNSYYTVNWYFKLGKSNKNEKLTNFKIYVTPQDKNGVDVWFAYIRGKLY